MHTCCLAGARIYDVFFSDPENNISRKCEERRGSEKFATLYITSAEAKRRRAYLARGFRGFRPIMAERARLSENVCTCRLALLACSPTPTPTPTPGQQPLGWYHHIQDMYSLLVITFWEHPLRHTRGEFYQSHGCFSILSSQ